MKVTIDRATFHRRRVEKIMAERRQGGMAKVRVEGWSDEYESAHAQHLVVELPDMETAARERAPAAWGLTIGGEARPTPVTAHTSRVASYEGGRSGQAAVIPLRDDRSCGSGELPEPSTRGGPSCLN